jgi:FliI/YscN family ATPase
MSPNASEWFTCCWAALETIERLPWRGRVASSAGLVVESNGPRCAVGDLCVIETAAGEVRCEAVGFRGSRLLLLPLDRVEGLQAGDKVRYSGAGRTVPVGPALLGRVVNGFGQPLDQRPAPAAQAEYPLSPEPPGPLEREPIREPLPTGIRAIDSLLTCGRGQRIGIFGGSGVGKSTLLGSLARHNRADVSVLALIGERNREVREFIEHDLGPDGLARSIVVVATSDQPAPLRVRACLAAVSIAEFFRDQGKDVLLVADSVTRLAMAQREIGLAAGEPPSQRGYTPSVFHLLPKVFERAGRFRRGSITAFFTVLVEGDDFNEPITDAVRGILDGHIILSRDLGAAGHYPAIDVLQSVSRLAAKVASEDHLESARRVRAALAELRAVQDLVRLGAYAAGSDPKVDAALRVRDPLSAFLRQRAEECSPAEDTLRRLAELAAPLGGGE